MHYKAFYILKLFFGKVAWRITMSSSSRHGIDDQSPALALLNFVTAWLAYEIAPNSIDVKEAIMR